MSINGSETPRQHEYVDDNGSGTGNESYEGGYRPKKSLKSGHLSKKALLIIASAVVVAIVIISIIF